MIMLLCSPPNAKRQAENFLWLKIKINLFFSFIICLEMPLNWSYISFWNQNKKIYIKFENCEMIITFRNDWRDKQGWWEVETSFEWKKRIGCYQQAMTNTLQFLIAAAIVEWYSKWIWRLCFSQTLDDGASDGSIV